MLVLEKKYKVKSKITTCLLSGSWDFNISPNLLSGTYRNEKLKFLILFKSAVFKSNICIHNLE
jgi:hypothetical protein